MQHFICYTDGGARGNPGNSGIGIVIQNAKGELVLEKSHHIGHATNNFAEYEAVIFLLTTLRKKLGEKTERTALEIRMDSELVVRQLGGIYKVKEETLKKQFAKVDALRKHFSHSTFVHVRREQNKDADRLANEAMDRKK